MTTTLCVAVFLSLSRASQSSNQNIPQWRAKAEDGDSAAQERLGEIYLSGEDVVRDKQEAVTWFPESGTPGQRSGHVQPGGGLRQRRILRQL